MSRAPGAAIHMDQASSTLTCTIEKEVTFTPKDPATKTAGDTDIACENVSSKFVVKAKNSLGSTLAGQTSVLDTAKTLVLNTTNPNWNGSTTVSKDCVLVVGKSPAYPNASWGNPTKTGDVTFENGATLYHFHKLFINSNPISCPNRSYTSGLSA